MLATYFKSLGVTCVTTSMRLELMNIFTAKRAMKP